MTTWISRIGHFGYGTRVAVKDLIDVAGVPTTNGSKVIAATAAPAAADAACLAGTRAAEAAGQAIIVGKTNLHELAYGITGVNPWFGTPENPLDALLVPGGSSSGSAVAVGTGEAGVAFGSDTGGSIRIPAACCGVTGLKTTYGRIPLDGVRPLAPSLDTVGPLGANVAAVVAGMQLLEPGFTPAAAPATRIGRLRLPATDAIEAAIDTALARAGLEVVDIRLPGWQAAEDATMVVLGAEAWQVHRSLWEAHAAELSPDVAERLARGPSITAEREAAARATATNWQAALADAFARVDLIALPTLAAPPPTLAHPERVAQIRYTSPINLAGVPAIALPVPTPPSGGPVPASLQLVGPAGSEALLVATASVIEADA